jgi:hypothetical protein
VHDPRLVETVRAGFKGFGLTTGICCAVMLAIYAASPIIILANPPDVQTLFASVLKSYVFDSVAIIVTVLAGYWLTFAVLAKRMAFIPKSHPWLIYLAFALFISQIPQVIIPRLRDWIRHAAMYDCTPPCPTNGGFCFYQALICPNALGWAISALQVLAPIALLLLSLYLQFRNRTKTATHTL